ncbi:MAG: FtsW/RodA/SpoVE family cell cycle protein, partial [Clostridia bacterium]|nr:FtsW/RodA/SpoVE family cell cycle protein [Clostridia bacterium]
DEGWQTAQGQYAIGSGGFLGTGLGGSRQKYSYVSEPQNDFIFTIWCEEMGFVGAVAVIVLFLLFLWRGIVIATRAPDTFSALAVLGIVGHVSIQAFLNIGVVTGALPNTGVSLPFFSYGGTSTLVLLMEMGVLLAVSRHSYIKK